MKVALFSDIHANLPALEAFLNDIEKRKPDAVYCLGDLVGYNIWPNEVINEIRNRRIPTIAGNYDFGIGRTSDDCGCAYKTDKEKEMGAVSISFTNGMVKEEERKYLRALPAQIRIEFQLNKPYHRILSSAEDKKQHYRHAINIGSVGKPKDNDPWGCYVILHINEHSSVLHKETITAEYIRFEYDIEKAAKAVEESELPNEYADMLRKGY